MNTMIGGCKCDIYSRRCDDDPSEESTVTWMDDHVTGREEREGRTYVLSKDTIGGEKIVAQPGGDEEGRGHNSWNELFERDCEHES